jgi:hypothetical protein
MDMNVEGTEQRAGHLCNVMDRCFKRLLVCPGRLVVSADFSHKLKCGIVKLGVAGKSLTLPSKFLDIPAHWLSFMSE